MIETAGTFRREEQTWRNRRGMKLFERRWIPAVPPRAVIVLIHGYAEHTGRYDHVGAWLAARGFALRGFDLRGHGLSDGDRARVKSFNEFLDDVREYVPRVRAEHAGVPLFVLGHSMGGAVTALWLAVDAPRVDGVLLSGPLAATGRANPFLPLLNLVGRIAPSLPLAKLDADSVSRDPDVRRRYDGDPLNYRGRVQAAMAAAAVRATRRTDRDAGRIVAPIMFMHGTEDTLAPPDGSRRLHDRVGSRDRTLKFYDGLYHEVLNEPEREQVLEDMLAWLDRRI